MQMVANGYGITLVPRVAVDAEVHDERVKLLRFAQPGPGAMSAWPGAAPLRAKRISRRSPSSCRKPSVARRLHPPSVRSV